MLGGFLVGQRPSDPFTGERLVGRVADARRTHRETVDRTYWATDGHLRVADAENLAELRFSGQWKVEHEIEPGPITG